MLFATYITIGSRDAENVAPPVIPISGTVKYQLKLTLTLCWHNDYVFLCTESPQPFMNVTHVLWSLKVCQCVRVCVFTWHVPLEVSVAFAYGTSDLLHSHTQSPETS